MMALWEKDSITIAELIDKTVIDGSALTQILKKMSDKQLLAVIKDAKDKRKRVVKLSESGQALKLEALSIPDEIRCKFSSVDAEQAQQLMTLLDLLVKDLSPS
jgi:DNA-binding MarR family transcriptional regulator